MISDTERREVARRLRENAEAHPDMSLLLNVAFADDSLRLDGAMEWKVTPRDAAMRLADLIEPSCDRDALLALAEEIASAGYNEWLNSDDFEQDAIARRIREACGEAANGVPTGRRFPGCREAAGPQAGGLSGHPCAGARAEKN